MQLADMPGKDQTRLGKSAVDVLPPEVVAQLVSARQNDTHSVNMMIRWLHSIGHETVSTSGLSQWFHRNQIVRGSACEA
jgi:hypothetical protein